VRKPRVLLLFSGGLDSLVAARLLLETGCEVEAVHFITPFTGGESGLPGEEYLAEWGIGIRRIRISLHDYLPLLTSPPHGFGRALNACIDCKILFLRKAKEIMDSESFDAVATGEVLGERPMSQNRLSLDIIERESGLRGLLLRPLSAALLPPTQIEASGFLDRSLLLSIQGRSRRQQLELASKWDIRNFATPSGGCLVTEVQYSKKLRDLLDHPHELTEENVALLKTGRHFRHSGGARLIVGKNKEDNDELALHSGCSRFFLEVREASSPIGLLFLGTPGKDEVSVRGENEVFLWGSGIVARYSDARYEPVVAVTLTDTEGIESKIRVTPAHDDEVERWRL
jgi:tRNA-specific 2-thiouridylase